MHRVILYKSYRTGFTLLELAIVLVVLSLLAAGIMALLAQDTRRAKAMELEARLEAVHDALLAFRRLNDRLPCPADATLAVGSADFGVEAATPGTCTGGAPEANFDDGSNTVGGVLPVKSLGLPDTHMFDPWGGRLTYAVDIRATEAAAFTTYGPADTTIGSIQVNDGSGNARTTQAVAVIVSHGANGHGAYQLNGTRKSIGSTNSSEQLNCHCNASAADDVFTNVFDQHEQSGDYSDLTDSYDDTVVYYVRSHLLSAAEEAGL